MPKETLKSRIIKHLKKISKAGKNISPDMLRLEPGHSSGKQNVQSGKIAKKSKTTRFPKAPPTSKPAPPSGGKGY